MPPTLRPRASDGSAQTSHVYDSTTRKVAGLEDTRLNTFPRFSASLDTRRLAWSTSGANWARINAERSRLTRVSKTTARKPGHIETVRPAQFTRTHNNRTTDLGLEGHNYISRLKQGDNRPEVSNVGRTEPLRHHALNPVCPTSANTSAKRSRDEPMYQKRSEGGSSHCYSCSIVLAGQPVHACRLCADIRFCLQCCIKASEIHPHHPFKLIQPNLAAAKEPAAAPIIEAYAAESRRHQAQQRVQGGDDGEASRGQCQDRSDVSLSSIDKPGVEATPMIRLPTCASCGKSLPSLRYLCQTCSDTNFCSRCRGLHLHPLKTFTCPTDSSSDSSSDYFSENDQSSKDGLEDDRNRVENDESDYGGIGEGSDSSEGLGLLDVDQDTQGDISVNGEGASDTVELIQRSAQIPVSSSQALYTNMTSEDVIQIKDALLAAAAKLQGILKKKGSQPALLSSIPIPTSLLNFPIEISTLGDGLDVGSDVGDSDGGELDGVDCDQRRVDRKHRRQRSTRAWAWTEKDRRQLRRMKEKGWTWARIATALRRSEGAAMQQWRKQKMGLQV